MFNFSMLTPEARFMLGAGIMGGQNFGQGVSQGAQMAMPIIAQQRQQQEAKQVENKTREWVQKMYPTEDVSQMPPDMLKMYANEAIKKQFAKPEKPNLISTRNGIYDADNKRWITPPAGAIDGNPVKHGLTPVWGVKNGKRVLGTIGEDATFTELKLPDGFEPTPGVSNVDLGTSVVVRDNKSGETVRVLEKDVAGVEKQKVLGETEGKQVAASPADLQAGLNAKSLIESLKTDPNREWGTGWSGWLTNSIPATPGKDYQTKVDQAKSGAFLTAIQQLRGMGSLSNAEGDTATKAVTRMNTATSEEAFMEALTDYERIIDQGIANARAKIAANPSVRALPGTETQQNTNGVNTTSSGVKWKVPGQ